MQINKKNYIIIRYFFNVNSSKITFLEKFITPYKPLFKINEYFNASTENYYVEVVADFNHSTVFKSQETYERFIDNLGFKDYVLVKDFYKKQKNEDRYALFFNKTTNK